MAGVTYALADFVTGGPIVDLPVMEGASWSASLNAPDALSCKVDMRDPDVLALDLRSSATPKKTVLLARTDADVILAWGIVSKPRWYQDKYELGLQASGVLQYFNTTLIGPASARTATIVNPDGTPNVALDTTLTGWSLGTIGKKLIAQRLTWPGSPTVFVLPADEVGTRERTYTFLSLKYVGAALSDLVKVENGPDFAFDAVRNANGLTLDYRLRHGSEETPRIGVDAGSWSLGGDTPMHDFTFDVDGSEIANASWAVAGRQAGTTVASRALNDALTADGYPPADVVDSSHNDVSVQSTLDGYAIENLGFSDGASRDVSFTVRGDASPGLGQYRPGDTLSIEVPADHPYIRDSFRIRITSMSGDETGTDVKIGCVILDE